MNRLKCVKTFPVPERMRVLLYQQDTDLFDVGFYHDGMFWDQAGRAYHGLDKPIMFSHWCETPFVPVKNCGTWKEGICKRISCGEKS